MLTHRVIGTAHRLLIAGQAAAQQLPPPVREWSLDKVDGLRNGTFRSMFVDELDRYPRRRLFCASPRAPGYSTHLCMERPCLVKRGNRGSPCWS